MKNGVLAGFPVLDVKVTLFDGSYHDVDSNEMAFKVAGSMGFKKGALQANPVLLEPCMKVEVTTPEDYMGDVVGDLNRRRGLIEGMDDASPVSRSFELWYLWLKCLVMQQICAQRLRVGLHTPWSF